MTTLLSVSSRKARVMRASTRILFLLIGISVIVMEIAFPPVKTLWLVSGYFLATVLIVSSIIGLSPRLRVSGFGMVVNNLHVHIATSFLLGMGVIIAAMINPPVHLAWFSFFNFIGIVLVFDAIITSSWNMSGSGKKSKVDDKVKTSHATS